jgi:hypothetical protein
VGVRKTLAARLIDPSTPAPTDRICCVQIRAPVTGRVLKIIQESEAVVQPGTPLLEIGDSLDLEIIADLLSTDAVQIKPGSPARIDGWGGSPIRGRVTRVDPAGFLKVSTLGIEEQRVRVTIDFVEPTRSLVLARTRFPGGRPRYNLEWRRRLAGSGRRTVSKGGRLGSLHREGWADACDPNPGWSS